MDTTDPEIKFDDKGICHHCRDFIALTQKMKLSKFGNENLQKIIKQIKEKGKGSQYDVLLGISGGVDSCYTAYLLKEYGLRVLLLHVDNGWNSDQAIVNIRKVAEELEFDYESYVLDWNQFKNIQIAFLKASVVEAETPTDIAILSVLHKKAAENKIKFIVSGGNLQTEGILPRMWHYNAKDLKYFNFIVNKFSTVSSKGFPKFGLFKEIYYKFIKGIKILYLLNYTHYEKEQAKQLLIEKFGWIDYGGKHHESRYTKFIQSYLLPTKFQLDYRKATLSSQICSGEITREEAIEILKTPGYNKSEIEKDIDYIAKKLNLDANELKALIAKPGKFYYEYPNNDKILTALYKIYNRFFNTSSVRV